MQLLKISLAILLITSSLGLKSASAGDLRSFSQNLSVMVEEDKPPINLSEVTAPFQQAVKAAATRMEDRVKDEETFGTKTLYSLIESCKKTSELLTSRERVKFPIRGLEAQRIKLVLDQYLANVEKIEDSLRSTKGVLHQRSQAQEASISDELALLQQLEPAISSVINDAISSSRQS